MTYRFATRLVSIGCGLLALSGAHAAQVLTTVYYSTQASFIDQYTITTAGLYRFTAEGAAGGNFGGAGASVTMDYNVAANSSFDILIGRHGTGTGSSGGQGGGGTFVILAGRPFVIAGGGGGSGTGPNGDGGGGQFGTSGSAGIGSTPGGRGGAGGSGGSSTATGGRGGGGYSSAGIGTNGGHSYSEVIASKNRQDLAVYTTGGSAMGGAGGGGGGYSGGGGGFSGSTARQKDGGGGGGSYVRPEAIRAVFNYNPRFVDGDGSFRIERIDEIMPPSAVPEPATWAMMLVGFGSVGAATRRRRRAAVLS